MINTSLEMQVPQRAWVRTYRAIFAVLALGTLGYHFTTQSQRPGFEPGNFFSFFTNQSNLIAGFLLLYLAARRSVDSPGLDLVRGAVVASMILMSVVHALLLSGYEAYLRIPEPSVDMVLHQVMPLVLVLDWLIQPPRSRVNFARATTWAIYPLLYFGYTLVRGSQVDWYPYYFLDPRREGGYPALLAICAVILVGFLFTIWLLVTISQRLRIRIAVR